MNLTKEMKSKRREPSWLNESASVGMNECGRNKDPPKILQHRAMYLQMTFPSEMYKEAHQPHLKSIPSCPDASSCGRSPLILLIRWSGPFVVAFVIRMLVVLVGLCRCGGYTLAKEHSITVR